MIKFKYQNKPIVFLYKPTEGSTTLPEYLFNFVLSMSTILDCMNPKVQIHILDYISNGTKFDNKKINGKDIYQRALGDDERKPIGQRNTTFGDDEEGPKGGKKNQTTKSGVNQFKIEKNQDSCFDTLKIEVEHRSKATENASQKEARFMFFLINTMEKKKINWNEDWWIQITLCLEHNIIPIFCVAEDDWEKEKNIDFFEKLKKYGKENHIYSIKPELEDSFSLD